MHSYPYLKLTHYVLSYIPKQRLSQENSPFLRDIGILYFAFCILYENVNIVCHEYIIYSEFQIWSTAFPLSVDMERKYMAIQSISCLSTDSRKILLHFT